MATGTTTIGSVNWHPYGDTPAWEATAPNGISLGLFPTVPAAWQMLDLFGTYLEATQGLYNPYPTYGEDADLDGFGMWLAYTGQDFTHPLNW